MKVIQVVGGIGHESSGTSAVMPRMCECLANVGCEVELQTLNPLPRCQIRDVKVIAHPCGRGLFRRLGVSPQMREALCVSCKDAQIVQTNGLWMMQSIYPDASRRGTACKLVVMPHGTLSEWALRNSRIKKIICGVALGQYAVLRHADMLVATSEQEYREIRAFGLKAPVAIIPNGIDVPSVVSPKAKDDRRIVFLSRIHPKKGVDILLRAWRQVQDEFCDWSLLIAGPLDEYAKSMEALAKELECKRCRFVGEVNGAAKDRFYGESELLVLPTHSENFGMVVAEALVNGTPVICSKGAPWAGLNDNCCGEWIDIGVIPLVDAFRKCLSRSRDELTKMGQRGREWMQRDFGWDKIGRDFLSAYKWLSYGGEVPNHVRID